MPHKFVFKTTPAFRTALRKLTARQKASARTAFRIFTENPFDARLRTHKIHGLSAKLRRTIYSISIEPDLRAIFYIEGSVVVSLDIGDHAIYRN
jgi:mRNA-degrading endonuclease YafQ of YafQ-DinJ toxin-antitoxin module